jgi:hypothetical protein
MTPLPAPRALDQGFLELRGKILEVAATLDRFDRGEGSLDRDPRVASIKKALETLLKPSENRAEQIQTIFSQDYDPNWERPQPRY